MAESLEFITLCGSLRAGSFNRMLCQSLPDLAPRNVRFTEAPSHAHLPNFDPDLTAQEGVPDGVHALAEAIGRADGLVIVTPEYNYSIPGALKNAIDWLSRLDPQPFFEKPVALQSTATGLLGGARAQYHLRQVLLCLQARVLADPEVFVPFARNAFDAASSRLASEDARHFVREQLAAFADFASDPRRG